MKFKLIIIFLFITSCGYTALYKDYDEKTILVKEKIFKGENFLNNKIFNKLNTKESADSLGYTIEISSDKKTDLLSKNKSGEARVYKMTITTKLIVKREGKNYINKNFVKNITYNNLENKFDLIKYEKNLEDNLINQIANDIELELLNI